MKKIIVTMVAFILAMGLLSGCGNASKKGLMDKALELEKEYGVITVGEKRFLAEENSQDISFHEEIKTREQGILFSDIYDYDGDGTSELLVLRRQEGFVNCDSIEGYHTEVERSEYIFEMYEYDESYDCTLSSQFMVGVADSFNIFITETSMSVFRRTVDRKTDIFMETTMMCQDHPEDICLLRLQYENGKFSDYGAIRYGELCLPEGNVLYMEPNTMEAFGILSYYGSANKNYWDIIMSADTYNASIKNSLSEGLSKYGLTLRKTRIESLFDFLRKNQSVGEHSDEVEALMEMSAFDCYGTVEGSLTPLAFSYLHLGYENTEWGTTYLKLGRIIYTDDPQGTERPTFDREQ